MNPAPKKSISIIWDFDGTLTPQDYTSELIKILTDKDIKSFWNEIKAISGSKKVNSISTSDAPVWMYVLSEITYKLQLPLDKSFLIGISDQIRLYPGVLKCLEKLKDLSKEPIYKNNVY